MCGGPGELFFKGAIKFVHGSANGTMTHEQKPQIAPQGNLHRSLYALCLPGGDYEVHGGVLKRSGKYCVFEKELPGPAIHDSLQNLGDRTFLLASLCKHF